MQALKDDGAAAETLQYVFLGVTVATAVTSAVLFYYAYSEDEDAMAAAGPRLSIAPTLTPHGAGVVGRWTF